MARSPIANHSYIGSSCHLFYFPNPPVTVVSTPIGRKQSHFTQGALAPGKCAALIALKLGELIVQFCQAAQSGVIRSCGEPFEKPSPDFSNSYQLELCPSG